MGQSFWTSAAMQTILRAVGLSAKRPQGSSETALSEAAAVERRTAARGARTPGSVLRQAAAEEGAIAYTVVIDDIVVGEGKEGDRQRTKVEMISDSVVRRFCRRSPATVEFTATAFVLVAVAQDNAEGRKRISLMTEDLARHLKGCGAGVCAGKTMIGRSPPRALLDAAGELRPLTEVIACAHGNPMETLSEKEKEMDKAAEEAPRLRFSTKDWTPLPPPPPPGPQTDAARLMRGKGFHNAGVRGIENKLRPVFPFPGVGGGKYKKLGAAG